MAGRDERFIATFGWWSRFRSTGAPRCPCSIWCGRGNTGLIRAVEVRLRKRLVLHLRDLVGASVDLSVARERIVRLPVHVAEQLNRVVATSGRWSASWGVNPISRRSPTRWPWKLSASWNSYVSHATT